MLIECILRRPGGTRVSLPDLDGSDVEYHFIGDGNAPHVADVELEHHVERFLAIPEGYRLARLPMSPEEAAKAREEAIARRIADEKAKAEAEEAARIAAEIAEREAREAEELRERAARMILTNRAATEAEATALAKAEIEAEQTEEAVEAAPTPPEFAAVRAQQVETKEAEAAKDRAAADDVRSAGTMTLAQARTAYHARFGRAPNPRMKLTTILEQLSDTE